MTEASVFEYDGRYFFEVLSRTIKGRILQNGDIVVTTNSITALEIGQKVRASLGKARINISHPMSADECDKLDADYRKKLKDLGIKKYSDFEKNALSVYVKIRDQKIILNPCNSAGFLKEKIELPIEITDLQLGLAIITAFQICK